MEARLFEEGTVPEWTTPEWYAGREAAPHLEQEGHRQRLFASSAQVHRALAEKVDYTVVDLGAGDGGLLSTLPALTPKWGYDLQQTNVDAARTRGVDGRLADVVGDPDSVTWGDVVVVTEMLEHLVDPHGFVRRIRDSGARWLVASSPYTETAESHYGFHTWAWDVDGYAAMLSGGGYSVVDTRLAWISQCVLARRIG